MDKGIPELVAHRLSDDRRWDAVKDLTWGSIMHIVYGKALSHDKVAKAKIIYYLIDPENRPNPADNMPDKPPTFGIFNWWWGEDYEEPNHILKEWQKLSVFNTQELRNLLKSLKRTSSGEKPVLLARLMKEDLERLYDMIPNT